MPPKPNPLKDPKKRKLMIYGGLAAAMLLIYLMSRKSSGQTGQTAADQAAAQAAANQAAQNQAGYGSLGSGAGGVDPSPAIAGLDQSVQTLSDQVAAWENGQTTPGPTTPTNDPFGDFLAGLEGGVGLYQAGFHAGPGGRGKKTRTQTKPKGGAGKTKPGGGGKGKTGKTTTTAGGTHKHHHDQQQHHQNHRKRRGH